MGTRTLPDAWSDPLGRGFARLLPSDLTGGARCLPVVTAVLASPGLTAMQDQLMLQARPMTQLLRPTRSRLKPTLAGQSSRWRMPKASWELLENKTKPNKPSSLNFSLLSVGFIS